MPLEIPVVDSTGKLALDYTFIPEEHPRLHDPDWGGKPQEPNLENTPAIEPQYVSPVQIEQAHADLKPQIAQAEKDIAANMSSGIPVETQPYATWSDSKLESVISKYLPSDHMSDEKIDAIKKKLFPKQFEFDNKISALLRADETPEIAAKIEKLKSSEMYKDWLNGDSKYMKFDKFLFNVQFNELKKAEEKAYKVEPELIKKKANENALAAKLAKQKEDEILKNPEKALKSQIGIAKENCDVDDLYARDFRKTKQISPVLPSWTESIAKYIKSADAVQGFLAFNSLEGRNRSTGPRVKEGHTFEQLQQEVDNLSNSVKAFKATRDIELYRGIRSFEDANGKHNQKSIDYVNSFLNASIGDVIHNAAFSSTTTDKETSRGFMDFSEDLTEGNSDRAHKAMLVINLKSGQNVLPMNSVDSSVTPDSAREHLLDKGSRFKVTKIDKENNFIHLELMNEGEK
jgi:hypothetical protein